jgi:hypothetical protein
MSQLRYLALAYNRLSQTAGEALLRATDQTRADSTFLLKHLNLEQTLLSTSLPLNIHTVHFTDRVV